MFNLLIDLTINQKTLALWKDYTVYEKKDHKMLNFTNQTGFSQSCV